jgi:hypothetical protein
VSSLITAIIVIAISISSHAGVWIYRKCHPLNEVPDHGAPQCSSTEGVYEMVDDKTDTEMIMIANEAYGTTATTTI